MQRWIADAIASVDDWIEVSNSALEISDILISKIADETMEDGQIDGVYELHDLASCCENIKVGIATSTTKHYSSGPDGVPMILNRSIKVNDIDRNSLEFISKEFDFENRRKRLMPGDVVVTRTGNPGLAAVVPDDMKGWQAFTTLILTPRADIIRSEYLSEWINSVHGQTFVKQGQAGGAQKNLNAGEIEKMPVRFPDLEGQRAIVSTISESRTYKKIILAETEHASLVKKALLAQLLSGSLQPKAGWEAVLRQSAQAAAP